MGPSTLLACSRASKSKSPRMKRKRVKLSGMEVWRGDSKFVTSKLYRVNATIIIFVFLLYCIVSLVELCLWR